MWVETPKGEVSVRLSTIDGKTVAEWRARSVDVRLKRMLAPGKYAVDIDSSRAEPGRGVLGVKGPVIGVCPLDVARVVEHPANPAAGFQWPYLLALPKEVLSNHLLVLPNNTGFNSSDLDLIRASASCQLRSARAMADRLGTPIVLPLFPRPALEEDNLYVHALSRATLETKVPELHRVDRQLVAMIEDARKSLGGDTSPQVLITGFSASGSFSSRFAFLHPKSVLAVAAGSPGGWPIAPIAEFAGQRLVYPVGIADVEALTGEAVDVRGLRSVSWFYFLGDRDSNDSVPFRDSFTKADEQVVFELFGKTPIARVTKSEEFYKQAGIAAQFKRYPNVGHSISDDMQRDVESFFQAALTRAH